MVVEPMGSRSHDGPMTTRRPAVLVVGTDEWAEDQAAGALRRAGATVLRCHEPGAPPFPCNAFIEGRTCPLDEGFDVAVTVRARSSRLTTPTEVGAVCALRTGHPLVVAGVISDNPFSSVATKEVAQEGDAVRACIEVAEACSDELIDLRHAHR